VPPPQQQLKFHHFTPFPPTIHTNPPSAQKIAAQISFTFKNHGIIIPLIIFFKYQSQSQIRNMPSQNGANSLHAITKWHYSLSLSPLHRNTHPSTHPSSIATFYTSQSKKNKT
jgi:hypothetical protein